jgi:hypothetical protein
MAAGMVHIGTSKDCRAKTYGTGDRTRDNVNGHGDPVRALSIAPFAFRMAGKAGTNNLRD